MPAASTRALSESSDAVGLIVALLVRFPEIATVLAHPIDGTLDFSFVVNAKIDAEGKRAVRELVTEHVRSLLELAGETHDVLEVTSEVAERMTFVHVLRDVRTMSREELVLLTSLLGEHFGPKLMKSPAPDESIDEDPAAQDELVEYALEALRDPSQQKSLVGFREEKRVLVYFLTARKTKKAKARARS
ncbi:MAG TPA: hypothetical protein VGD50_07690 [Candidatus Baltobacteraceae bacterium]